METDSTKPDADSEIEHAQAMSSVSDARGRYKRYKGSLSQQI